MATIKENPFVLVDGSSYLFRAFYAPPHLTNSKGEATGAVYGVINMLRSLINQYQPSNMVVVFDAKGPTFRNDMYSEYKANRPPMPDDLRGQIEPLHKLIKAMGIPLISVPGVEADDVIGTLATQASKQGIHTLISTGDKDMAQLVDDNVTLINTMTNTVLDREGVIEKFGVPPELIIDFLGLMGDSSDNIPGVPKVGEKTALGMLQGIGSINEIYQNIDKLATLSFRGAKSIGKRMLEHEEMARLSYQLATIKLDVELEESYSDFTMAPANQDQLIELFGQLEFKRWLSEALDGGNPLEVKASSESGNSETTAPSSGINTKDYPVIYTLGQLIQWVRKLENASLFAFDLETTSLNYMEAEIVGMSFAIKEQNSDGDDEYQAAYLPLAHDYEEAPKQIALSLALEKLTPLLEDASQLKVGQNLKYDRNVLANYDITLNGISHDTMLESYVLNSTAVKHNMDALALKYLGHKTIHFEDIAGKGAKQLTFNQIKIAQAAPYAAEDADVTLRLHDNLMAKLEDEGSLLPLFNDIEMPLLPVLSDIERTGVLIDDTQLFEQSAQLAKRIEELQQQAWSVAGEEFNLGSTKQLQDILFSDEKMALPVLKKTPKGAPSTNEEVLHELANDYELPQIILEYRSLTKLKTTYTDKLPLMINKDTGRVHTSYHQAVTATGRLSSTDPNLQNIPIRTDEGKRIRQAFVAPAGYKIVAIDYSQIELRIMAHLSQDSGLLTAFANNLDIHKATASEVFNTPFEEVTVDQRRSAKAVNFGLIYGMSAFGLAKQLDIPRGLAQQYIDSYFDKYPGVLQYMEDTRAVAADKGYVETLDGRRLYLADINARNGARRKAAERAAINAPMQGTAADIIKKAMLKVSQWLNEQPDDLAKMIMQVHDELVFEVKEDCVEQFCLDVQEIMAQAADLDVPLIAEAGAGDNWQQAH
ncbi:DNA polymerase I [Psychrobium sp. 1_MG-2023]|uniref:DNA polymerase I n=1 Tax=Psychrobium sp. 1_MG-2023 TaxID=3062624 RepID=UPI000C32E9CC|nr:DNA polymerase I [Psychrobium sp. 1_MG-2023]MDP2560840.1 DNA polymerase I [Psychrobium sp. 1_MG-2023]PKF56714.1 DNA polymerase I [Alteromonadales bacterium alter-6D02]